MDIGHNKVVNKTILSIYNHRINALDELFDLFQREKKQFNAINLATLLHNFSKLIPEKNTYSRKKYLIEEVVRLIPSPQFQFDAQSISNILRALSIWSVSAKEKIYKEAILCLVEIIPGKINTFNAQQIANVLNALAKWDISTREISCKNAIQALVCGISKQITTFNAQNISNALNALSKWDIPWYKTPYKEAISCLVAAIPQQVDEFNAKNIANVLNALSKWKISLHQTPYQETISCLVAAIPQQVDEFNAQDIANSLNALAKWKISSLETPYQEAILCLVATIPEKINTFIAQEIANVLNALSKWDISIHQTPYKEAISCLVAATPKQIDEVNTQEIANVLNALSKWDISIHQTPYKEAISCLVAATPKQIDEFNAQEIANVLNALSKWKISLHESLYQETISALARAIPKQVKLFTAQGISNSLNALSKWDISLHETPYQESISCLIGIIPEKITTFSSQSLVNSLNALAKLALPIQSAPYRPTIECLLQQIEKTVKFNTRDSIAIAFALCLFKFTAPNDSLFKNNQHKIRSLFERDKSHWFELLDNKTARQIYQINLYQKNVIPDIFLNKIPSFIPKLQCENLVSSTLQKSVFTRLTELNPIFVEEYFIQFTHVDMASPENKIALQVNGPSHYQGKILNISSRFNNYLLEKLGWSVVVVPYFEWNKLTDDDKDSYLCNKLSALRAPVVLEHAIKDRPANKITTTKKSIPDTRQQKKLVAKKKPKKIIFAPPEKVWKNLIEKTPSLEKVRSDELHAAYGIFISTYRTIVTRDALKTPKELDAFKKITAERLEQAIYLKKIELLAPKTVSAFFQCKPCRYGLRLNASSHPKEAFSKKTIVDTFDDRRYPQLTDLSASQVTAYRA